MKTRPTHLRVGEIRKPHGIQGEVFVVPTTDNVELIYERDRELELADAEGRPIEWGEGLKIVRARSFKNGLIVKFEGLEDRNAADMLRGRTLAIPAEEVPPLEDEEYFLHDLTDLEVRGSEGAVLGRVSRVYTIGGANLLGIDDGERERLVPFSREVVRGVSVEEGWIEIEPPPGLLEL